MLEGPAICSLFIGHFSLSVWHEQIFAIHVSFNSHTVEPIYARAENYASIFLTISNYLTILY